MTTKVTCMYARQINLEEHYDHENLVLWTDDHKSWREVPRDDSVQSFADHAVKSIQDRFNSLLLSSSSRYGMIQVN